jgi:uncharacterized C2H2 Zn-finger protein
MRFKTMGLFKRKEKSGVKCPACGSFNTSTVKGTQVVISYPGFYSGVSNNPETKEKLQQCKDCKNIFRSDN